MNNSGNLKSAQQPPVYQQSPPQFQQPQTANPLQHQQPFNQSMQPQPAQHVVHHHSFAAEPESGLPTVTMAIGIVCASLMLIGLIPCLGWINWFVLLVGGVNKLLSIIAVVTARSQNGRNKAIIGLETELNKYPSLTKGTLFPI